MSTKQSCPLHHLGENALLTNLLVKLPEHSDLLLGPGDDCALIRSDDEWDLLLKTDVVVEGVHFERGCKAGLVGRKALARALSDIAAMGGIPQHALITLLIHPSREYSYVKELYEEGLCPLARQWEVSIAGGETSSLPYDGLIINISLTGKVERGRAVLRSGAKAGDIICVSGKLGGSFSSGRHLSFEPRITLARELIQAQLAPRAMMDLSDGLAVDLARLCKASGLAHQLELSALPRHEGCDIQAALSDGEDYELLMCLSPEQWEEAQQRQWSTDITAIGCMIEGSLTPNIEGGWNHFLSPSHEKY